MTSAHDRLPDQLNDIYEFVRELGGSNSTIVYLARVRTSGHLVAIKAMRQRYLKDDDAAARFAREARSMSRLQHPNIVRTIAVEHADGRPVAIIMEYLEGGTLRELLKTRGRLSFEESRTILRDIAQALEYAHGLGIVHRDVKPENVFVEKESGRALLSDFGIAHELTADTRLTIAGSAVGTPTYMSPEQIDGQAVDARSDIYSLGLLGWELVTGLKPWDGETLYGVIYKQKHESLPSIRSLRADCPVELREAIDGAMRKSPDERWDSAAEFVRRLEAATIEAAADGADDLPTLHFRRPDETLKGVALGAAVSPVGVDRPTEPIEREFPLERVDENRSAPEREVTPPRRKTVPRRRLDRRGREIGSDLDVTAASSAALAAETAAQLADTGDPTGASPAPDDVSIAHSTTANDDVSISRHSERREVPRASSGSVADEPPSRVPAPRRRSPLLILIPSIAALAGAILVTMKGGSDNGNRDLTAAADSLVSGSSAGDIRHTAPDSMTLRVPSTSAEPNRESDASAPSPQTTSPRTRSQVAGSPPTSSLEETVPQPDSRTAQPDTPLLDRIADNDVELNRVYRNLISTIRQSRQADSGAEESLRVRQRRWLVERDAACRAGTIEERANCFRDESRRRSMELNAQLQELRPPATRPSDRPSANPVVRQDSTPQPSNPADSGSP
jgi:serine/threonine protein kinase